MNQILQWLAGDDLRSDGMADEAADFVLQHPELIEDLVEGLDAADDVMRGRTADALEKVARARPDLVLPILPILVELARTDRVAMVKMHLAMILGHLALYPQALDEIAPALYELLEDESVFSASWAITSLCIVARQDPNTREEILLRVTRLEGHSSTALRTRVRKALKVLTSDDAPFPKGWIKSQHLQEI